MNDYPPYVYALIEGSSPTGYRIEGTEDGWILIDASTDEVLDPRPRTLEDMVDTIARYGRLTDGLSR